jgi:hypothetical protein
VTVESALAAQQDGVRERVTLVVAAPYDEAARWVAQRLCRVSSAPTVVVSPQALGSAPRFEHRIGARGGDAVIRLPDGSTLSTSRIAAVLNRFDRAASSAWDRARAGERAYVEQELHAIALAWLASLPVPVVNPATPRGLSGPCLSVAEWRMLAAADALAPLPYCESVPLGERGGDVPIAREVLAIGDICVGEAPAHVADGLRRLAAAARTPILWAGFAIDATGRWRFAHANPWPDFRRFGDAVLVPLARVLRLPLDVAAASDGPGKAGQPAW